MKRTPPVAKTSRSPIDDLLAQKAHPLSAEIQTVRELVLGVDASIREEVKWSSVSFRNVNDFFATINLRSVDSLQVILHTGVKRKRTAETGVPVKDPKGLIEKWPAKDRCVVSLGRGAELEANRDAFVRLVEAWTKFV